MKNTFLKLFLVFVFSGPAWADNAYEEEFYQQLTSLARDFPNFPAARPIEFYYHPNVEIMGSNSSVTTGYAGARDLWAGLARDGATSMTVDSYQAFVVETVFSHRSLIHDRAIFADSQNPNDWAPTMLIIATSTHSVRDRQGNIAAAFRAISFVQSCTMPVGVTVAGSTSRENVFCISRQMLQEIPVSSSVGSVEMAEIWPGARLTTNGTPKSLD